MERGRYLGNGQGREIDQETVPGRNTVREAENENGITENTDVKEMNIQKMREKLNAEEGSEENDAAVRSKMVVKNKGKISQRITKKGTLINPALFLQIINVLPIEAAEIRISTENETMTRRNISLLHIVIVDHIVLTDRGAETETGRGKETVVIASHEVGDIHIVHHLKLPRRQ